ncbi:MAG: hypothetical protein LBS80_04635 [Tannerella sp.]|nr:hypothetical protein [Tannerella sp.]
MAADLEMLPVWYGGGSFTLVRNMKASQFVASQPRCFRTKLSSPMILSLMMKELFRCMRQNVVPKLPPLTARIWGLSPRSIDLLLDFKRNGMNIEVPEWNDEYAELTKRQTGARCLTRLKETFPVELDVKAPEFFSNIEELQAYVAKNRPPYVMKLPLSSSGRGLYWLDGNTIDARATSWISGALKRQSAISIESALDKALDFAAEFYSDGKGNVNYEGLSIFETQDKGQFAGCILNTQAALLQQLNKYISPEDYMFLVKQVINVLQEIIGSKYEGYLGVDMLIYKDNDGNYAVHPFVELNLRYTMGYVAMKISRQFVHPSSRGILRINYHVYDAEKEHRRMTEASPLVLEGDLIRSGYISLCPVTNETHYLATVEVFE